MIVITIDDIQIVSAKYQMAPDFSKQRKMMEKILKLSNGGIEDLAPARKCARYLIQNDSGEPSIWGINGLTFFEKY